MKALTPAARNSRTLPSTWAGLRVRLSVPSAATRVVTPALSASLAKSSGVRKPKPPSPPPPVMWASGSTSPGTR